MTPTDWIPFLKELGLPYAMCVGLLLILHMGLSRGFGATHARLDKADLRAGAMQYLLGVAAGEAAAKVAEEMCPMPRAKGVAKPPPPLPA